ncbi:hypothetical protein [Pectobacterium aroidearum]|nr:hypothetical protein [Pectobacterium aroidearum]MDY4386419.1 hypothetical protein [Pectobacterium aroidearum]
MTGSYVPEAGARKININLLKGQVFALSERGRLKIRIQLPVSENDALMRR